MPLSDLEFIEKFNKDYNKNNEYETDLVEFFASLYQKIDWNRDMSSFIKKQYTFKKDEIDKNITIEDKTKLLHIFIKYDPSYKDDIQSQDDDSSISSSSLECKVAPEQNEDSEDEEMEIIKNLEI